MDPTTLAPTVPELLDTWESALASVADLAETLTPEEWAAATPCPGWSVADVVAHTADIEAHFGGEPKPDHTPDWEALPHVTSPFGQFTELGVDYRRGRTQAEVIAELRARTVARRAQLDEVPADGTVPGFSGGMVAISRFLRTRTFDIWAHEQDIRAAVGQDGNWGNGPAVISFQQMAGALPHVWGKSVEAPVGSVVRVTVLGPELAAEFAATIDDEGNAVAGDVLEGPDVHLACSWPDYMRMSCGRIDVHDAGLRERIDLHGDAVLAEALLPALAITP